MTVLQQRQRRRSLFFFQAIALYLPQCVVAFARWGPTRGVLSQSSLSSDSTQTPRSSSSSGKTTVSDAATPFVSSSSDYCLKTIDVLSLDSIRSSLIRQEETIIFALIERAQFRQNTVVYRPGGFGPLGLPPGSREPTTTTSTTPSSTEELSFLEYMLVGTEALHCGARRYLSPEEHAFFPNRLPLGPMPSLPSLQYAPELLSAVGGASDVNCNPRLLQHYIQTIVPSVCQYGDDEQHGSTVLCDIAVLQALSRRVHYGKFVAESKYRSDPDAYQRLVDASDAPGVWALLTNEIVEAQVVRRARLKAATYGSDSVNNLVAMATAATRDGTTAAWTTTTHASMDKDTSSSKAVDDTSSSHSSSSSDRKIDAAVMEQIYRDFIIPLTKDVEVAYLFRRCGKQPPPHLLFGE